MRLGRRTPVALALQGGGALGAFTWGLLDRLLEDGRLAPRAFSGASAGAMNAVVAADGLAAGGPEEARTRLDAFWRAVAGAGGGFGSSPSTWASFWRGLGGASGAGFAALDAMLKASSPYDRTAGNRHPLRAILEQHVDFERLRRARRLAVFVSATDVRTGAARVFAREELSVDVLLASACLPALFHAVEIDGAAYWDGGYVANPPLLALLGPRLPRDVVLVPLNPARRSDAPRSADDIVARVNEITFHAPYLGELRSLALAKRLSRGGLAVGLPARARALRLHVVEADGALAELSGYAKLQTDLSSLEALRDRGRAAAAAWLDGPARDVGRRGGVDLEAAYVDGERWAR
jgi:NTE family protein